MKSSTARALVFGATMGFASLSGCADDAGKGAPTDTLDDSLAFNEIAMRCTHNSYHIQQDFLLDPSHGYDHAPLDVQLGEYGVRAFELDIHPGEGFPVLHIPMLDERSTCENLETCLGVMASWSKANPHHHMVVVWIEVKDELHLSRQIDDYDALDAAIERGVGAGRLYRPSDFRRGHATLRDALDAEGWPTVGETRGRMMVVLLDTDAPHYEGYREGGREGAMFSRARMEDRFEPWAVVAKHDNPADVANIQLALEANMLVASNIGSAGSTYEHSQARLDAAVANGVHMLCDDFPAPVEGQEYWLELPGWEPSTCNVVTAGADRCSALESVPE